MTRAALIIAAMSLSGCQFAMPQLPTPAEICAMPPADLAALADAMKSTPEQLAFACAVVK